MASSSESRRSVPNFSTPFTAPSSNSADDGSSIYIPPLSPIPEAETNIDASIIEPKRSTNPTTSSPTNEAGKTSIVTPPATAKDNTANTTTSEPLASTNPSSAAYEAQKRALLSREAAASHAFITACGAAQPSGTLLSVNDPEFISLIKAFRAKTPRAVVGVREVGIREVEGEGGIGGNREEVLMSVGRSLGEKSRGRRIVERVGEMMGRLGKVVEG